MKNALKQAISKFLVITFLLSSSLFSYSLEYVNNENNNEQTIETAQNEESLVDSSTQNEQESVESENVESKTIEDTDENANALDGEEPSQDESNTSVATEEETPNSDIISDNDSNDSGLKNDVIENEAVEDTPAKNEILENKNISPIPTPTNPTNNSISDSINTETLLKLLDSETLMSLIDTEALKEKLNVKEKVIDKISVKIKDFGAVGDGVTNDSAAFKAALNHIKANNGGVILFTQGVYKLEGYFTIPAKCKIIGSGDSNILLSGSFNLYNSDCTIDGLRIFVKQACRVFNIVNSKNITIKNCYVDGQGWNGDIPLKTGASGGVWAEGSKNIRIENNEMFNFKDYKGMDFMNSENIFIIKNKIHHTGRAGISLYRGNKNSQIMYNEVSHAVKNFTVGDGAIDLYGPNNEDTTIEGNIISEFGCEKTLAQGIRIHGSKNTKVINNTISSSKYSFSLIIVQQKNKVVDDGVIISGNLLNVLDQTHPVFLIRLDHGKNIRISTNIFKNMGTPDGNINSCISIRRDVQNCTINDNMTVDNKTGVFPSAGISVAANGHDYKNINIIGNILETTGLPILIYNLEAGVISSNILKSSYSKTGAITVVKSDKIIVTGNMIEQTSPVISTISTTNLVKDSNNFIKLANNN